MIKFTPTSKSKISTLDFNDIPFGQVFSDHIFMVNYSDGQWINPRIEELKPIPVHPGNLAWHYGQSIFEGMKATKDQHGNAMLFRPEMHIERLNASAERMCMPQFPVDLFMEAVHKIVDVEKDWIPPAKGSALYLRPLMIAMEEALGVRSSKEYLFMIMTLPVGPYYPKPVSLRTEQHYVRAADGGVGEAKTAGNYAASLKPAQMAKAAGFDQVMWLDAKEYKYVQEVGTMNIFFVIDGEILTPATGGTILKGITRDSAITMLRDKGYTVTERAIDIQEIMDAHKAGKLTEIFGTGTAAVVSKVNRLEHNGEEILLDHENYKIATEIKSTIDGLRYGDIEDKWGWVVPVEGVTVTV